MAEFIRIKGWAKYQHYKDRNPPWIKLHRELLTSLTWAMADDASRVLAVACMLLAAATDNKIPFDAGYVKRVSYLNADPDFTQLLKLDFLEVIDDKGQVVITAITPLADASKMQAHARPETETETETETEQRKRQKNTSSNSRLTDEDFNKAWEQYPRKVGRGAAFKAWANAKERHNIEFSGKAVFFIYQRIMTYAAFCNRSRKEKQFIPHMATWLNQDRFLDDPSEWAVPEGGNGRTSKAAEKLNRNRQAIISGLTGQGDCSNAGHSVPDVPRDRADGGTGVVLEGSPQRAKSATAT